MLVSAVLHLTASPAARAQDARAAAHEHFDRGLAASNEQHFGEAAEEFEAAYRLWPEFKVLYNIAKVNVALGRPVESVDAFESYLERGGAQIRPERIEEVRREIDAQMARIGTIVVRSSRDGAEVRVDGRLIGTTPLARPVRVGAGKHTVEALVAGLPSQLRDVDIAGKDQLEIEFDLAPPLNLAPLASAPGDPGTLGSPLQAMRVVQEPASDKGRSLGGRRLAGVIGACGGLAVLATGAALAISGAVAGSEARSRLYTSDPTTYDQALLDYDAAKNHNHLGWIGVGAGAALTLAGVLVARW